LSPPNASELVVVVGPTASGKTELALRLAEALRGEIVNADSVQVYRQFHIGTAKPTPADQSRVRHHLVDFVEPDAPLDAARWCELADASITDIHARGLRAIVCGGTFLWVKALLYGLADAPAADAAVRQQHRELVESEGRHALHRELAKVDPVSAARLNSNDFVRVSRALEVFQLSGKPLSSFQAAHGFREARYKARLFSVARERAELDRRIQARTRQMFDAGWIAEVRALLARGFGNCRAMQSVGYRQIAESLQSAIPVLPDELELRVYRATRVFARRQRTWLRDQAVELVAPSVLEEPLSNPVLERLFSADIGGGPPTGSFQ
jgi:tRNA dimethylallyltransferase